MKSRFHTYLFFFCCFSGMAQITGNVTNTAGEPLPYVNIYLEGSFTGTTTNEAGNYELEVSRPGDYSVVFQFLGYQTQNRRITVDSFPHILNVKMPAESMTLKEVVVNSGENPANKIMRNAIDKRLTHKNLIDAYTADFYSRGIWRIKDAPEKILGREIGDLGGSLDSTRSGVIYLSETVSEITYRAPNNFKEKIIASKVSGNDNGFSLNSAREATISFYNNTISLNSELISPLSDYAFNYYNFKLDGVFYNERGHLINKIEVLPRRPKDRVFKGYIYIVEDTWQIYGIDLLTTGEAIQIAPLEELVFKQNFNFSEEEQLYVPISQTIDFSFRMFGIGGNGRFTAVYTNYNFNPQLDRKTFTNEIVSFAPEANLKDSLYWQEKRSVPLTLEEKNDYQKKDSIQKLKNTRVYRDSLDRVRNKFQLSDLLTGYTYSNSYNEWSLSIDSPVLRTNINTVQGYNSTLDVSFRKNTAETFETYWKIFSELNYGLSEDRFRILGGYQQKFNNISNPVLTISGGSTVEQINNREPISPALNNITTAFFERNYLKLYELVFAEVSYGQELFNGFEAASAISIENRSPLFNHRQNFLVDWDERQFTSNDPLQPFNYSTAPFEEHRIFKWTFSGRIEFGQKYIRYPNVKYNLANEKYPSLLFTYEKGFGADIPAYNFDHLRAGLRQEFSTGHLGRFGYSLTGGTFFNDGTVSFIDYRHFNGNQTRIGTSSNYLDRFNLLPYYSLSTHRNYVEGHVEHDFRGWILGKIPMINRLNFNLVAGAHALVTEHRKPYREYSLGFDNIGFGKFRFMRLDYVISDFEGDRRGAFIFGLKFLGIL